MGVFTFVIAVTGVLQYCSVNRQLDVMDKQLAEMEKQSRETEEAIKAITSISNSLAKTVEQGDGSV